MDIKSKIRQEMLWKADLCSQGTRIERGALDGEVFKEEVRFLFEFNVEDPSPGEKIPGDMIFPEGTVAKLEYNPESFYIIRRENGQLFLEQHGKFITPIKFPDRPGYYDKKTSGGYLMQSLVPIFGECNFAICLSTTCNYFATGDECKFCNMNPALSKGDHRALLASQMPDQIAEILEEFIDEGYDPCLIITSGSLPEKTYCEAAIRIVESFKKRPKCSSIINRICCQMEVPKNLSWFDRLYEAGITRVDPNIEIWDPDMFRYICPGKSKRIGREHWLKGLRYAAKLFGPPYVYTGIVAGIETKQTIYEATDILTDMGVYPFITPWWTHGGTAFDGHRPPHPEWFLEITEKVVDMIVEKIPQLLDKDFYYYLMGGCYRCNSVTLHADEVRLRHNGLKKVFRKELKEAKVSAL